MPFLTASPTVASLIEAGALNYAVNLLAQGVGEARLVTLLTETFRAVSGEAIAIQTYDAIVRRGRAALNAGETMMNFCFDRPCARGLHVGATGLVNRFQYTTYVTYFDPNSGREYTRPIVIDSADALSGREIIESARSIADEAIARRETPSGQTPLGRETSIERITIIDALTRI